MGEDKGIPLPPWMRMSTPEPRRWDVEPKFEAVPARQAVDGRGTVDGPNAGVKFVAPAGWRFLGIHDAPEDTQGNEKFDRVLAGSAVIESTSQLEHMLDLGAAVSKSLLAATDPDDDSPSARVARGEEEHFRRLGPQHGYPPGYFRPPESPKRVKLPAWYRQFMRAMLRLYLNPDDPRVTKIPAPAVVIDTSAGWPGFQPGIGAKLLSATFWEPGRPFSESLHAAREWSAANGLPPVAALFNAYGTRTGTLAKRVRIYEAVANGFTSNREELSTTCRRRQIYMAPIPSFLALRTYTRCAKATRKYVLPGAWHQGDSDVTMMLRGERLPGVWVEIDISGYDTSIPRDYALELAEANAEARPELAQAGYDYAEIDDLGTIFPDPAGTGRSNRLAAAITREGLMSSGILPTAEHGNKYHFPVVLEVARRHGHVDPITDWLTGRLVFLIQGDDLLIRLQNPQPEVIAEVYKEAGLTAKIVRSNRFLMRFRFGARDFPVGGRIVQQTAFNEHERTGPHGLAFAVMGLAARWGASGPHESIAETVREAISLTSLGKLGIVDGPTAMSWIGGQGAERVARAMASAQGSAWYELHLRDAEYSPTSAALVALADRLGFKGQPSSEGVLGNLAINRLVSMTRSARLKVRNELWAAYRGGLSQAGLDLLGLRLLGIGQEIGATNVDDSVSATATEETGYAGLS